MLPDESKAIIQELKDPLFKENEIRLFIKREDLIHPEISGNKWRKLKYNLKEARAQNLSTLLTFGGAFSNHIAAVAAAGKLFDFKTIGIIRGEERAAKNPTLTKAGENGMELYFISREVYRMKSNSDFISQLTKKYGSFYLLPEGGGNDLAIKGSREIVAQIDQPFDVICCPVGTGGTITGIIASVDKSINVYGFPALKGNFLKKDIEILLSPIPGHKLPEWRLFNDYHFGGYAKITNELEGFMEDFKRINSILLDPVYTGKMMFGIYDLIKKDHFPKGTKIIAIHTGGLQGIEGFDYMKKPRQELKNPNVV
ncbi:MAG: pyridoxal-phosphate dependent enzyme [Bacteroidetes bacterium]|nr:pyridoxal-phosphate dependent enzyme [Bacteroidota bacterium]MDA1122538.1 pyridoxal-phosphate dependent enzyme [Bacteroidota bacterium]